MKFHYRYLRVSPKRFDYLLSLVEPLITKEDTNYRKSISPAERVWHWRFVSLQLTNHEFFLLHREVYSVKDNCWNLWCSSSRSFSTLCQATIVKQWVESDILRFWETLEFASCNWGNWQETSPNRMP